jgi:hypothetical protein
MGSMPIFTPPHVWDLMNDHDTIFNPNSLNPKKPTNNNGLRREDIDLTTENIVRIDESWIYMNLGGQTFFMPPFL